MWIQVKGHLQPDVNYRCIPEEEYDALKASHAKAIRIIESALRIKDLWVYAQDVKPEHKDEAAALASMLFNFEEFIKDDS